MQLVALIAPCILMEFFLYFFSVKKANIKSRNVYYRMIRTQIKTDQQNYDMFSTDQEEYDPEKDSKPEDMILYGTENHGEVSS